MPKAGGTHFSWKALSICFQKRGNTGSLPFSFVSLVLAATRPSSVSNRLRFISHCDVHRTQPATTRDEHTTPHPVAIPGRCCPWKAGLGILQCTDFSTARATWDRWALPTSQDVEAGTCQQGKHKVAKGG